MSLKKLIKSNSFTFFLYKKVKAVRKFFRGFPLSDFLRPSKLWLILRVKPYTLLSYLRLSNLYERVLDLKKGGASGSFVECGAWNGGSAGIIAKLAGNKKTWVFDSWEGMPEPTEHDIKTKGIKGEKGMAASSYEKAEELLFNKLKLKKDNVALIKGWFDQTIPPTAGEIGQISFLHLDCDWYESVKLCLETLYDQVVPGGIIVIDDYGSWTGAKKALEEFIKKRGLKPEFIKVDSDAVYFKK